MKKQILLVAVSVLALTTSANAGYITGSLGHSGLGEFTAEGDGYTVKVDGDSGFKFQAGYGDYFNEKVRWEATLSKVDYDTVGKEITYPGFGTFPINAKVKLGVTALEFNSFYEFKQKDSLWTPYLGGGLGFSQMKLEDSKDTVLTLQLKGGIAYKLDEKGTVFAELTSKGFAEASFDGEKVDDFGSFDVSIGYRYNF